MKSNRFYERGQALVLIALAAIGLFAIVGLAIDGNAKFSDRRHAQNAADTAALAAALAKVNALTNNVSDNSPTTGLPTTCPPPTGVTASPVCNALQLAGLNRAQSNGYDNNLVSDTVRVYSPPISGPYSGDKDYVQVIITSNVNTYFARIVGITQTRNTVQATALARKGGLLGSGAMLISYDPDPNCSGGAGVPKGSVDISGSATIYLNGGGIFLNSDEVCGYRAPNCPTVIISGGGGINTVYAGDNIDQSCNPAPEFYNQEPVVIPDDVYWPPVPIECGITPPAPDKLGEVMAGTPPKLTGEWLIHPGYYETFPPSDLVGNKQLIYMKSGIYCIDPGGPSKDDDLSWSPTDFVVLNGSTNPSKNKYAAHNTDGVTLYIKAGGGFALNSNNPTYLDATTKITSDYQGYLIVLEGTRSSIENCSITGGSNLDINGTIFAPYCNITVNGGSGISATINAQLLGWDLKITGNNTINFNYDPNKVPKIKRRVGLMR